MSYQRPPLPPFTKETAHGELWFSQIHDDVISPPELEKVKLAQKLWNTCDPSKVALAYTQDSIWRNRDQFPHGREEIINFLTKKWQKETRYKSVISRIVDGNLSLRISSRLGSERSSLRGQITKSRCSFGTSFTMKRSKVGLDATGWVRSCS